MELTPVVKELNIAYQPHPIAPLYGRTGMVGLTDGTATIRQVLLAADLDPYQPITIQLDGEMVEVSDWDVICPTEGQLLSVHATVQGGGGGSNAIAIVAMIAIAVVAPYAGAAFASATVGAGAASFAAVSAVGAAVFSIAGSLVIGALFAPKPPQISNNALPAVSPTYSLTGGQNRARLYEPMPVVFGEHRMFLDYSARPFTEYRGDDQYLYQIFNLGLGTLSASDYKIGTNDLSSYQDVEFVQPDVNGRLENFPGNVDSAPGAVVTQSAGAITRTTSANTYQIGIDLEATLYFANDQGGLSSRTVEIQVEIKESSAFTYFNPALTIYGDNATYDQTTGILTITGATQKPIRLSLLSSVAVGTYDVRLTRITNDSTNARESTSTSWSQLKSYQEDDSDYKGQNRVGLIIKASDQLNGVVQTLSALVTAQATYWNGTAFVTGQTDNPAHLFMHFARGVYNSDGKLMYGVGLTDSQIDFDSLHVWAQFCAAEGLSFNGVLDSTQTASDLLNSIATCGLGSPTWASGKLGAVFDSRNASPVMSFGMSNIIRNTFEVAYLSENLAEEIIVRFANPAKDYEQDEVRTVAPNVTTPLRTSSIDLFGCTDATMAGKFSNYLAAQQFYRRRRVTWESDFEGFVCQRGDVVLLSHDMTQWGYSGRFVSVDNNVVTLDRTVPRQNQVEYLMLIRPDGTTTTYDIAPTTDTESDTLTIVDNFFTLQSGADLIDHRWTFSPLETPGKKLKILSVDPASDSRLKIVATDEVPEFYDAWDGTFVAPTTETVLLEQPVSIVGLTLTNRVAFVDGFLTNRVAVSWGVGGGTLYSQVKIYLDGSLVAQAADTRVPYFEIDINGAGTLLAEVTPIGLTGSGLTQTATLSIAELDLPAPPETVTLISGQAQRAATFEWTPVLGVQSYVIEVVVSGAVKRSVNVGNTLSYTYTVEAAQADGGAFRAYTLRVYSVNQAGQSTTFTTAEFNNPQIGQLQNASIEPMPNSFWFKADRPTEADFAAVKVWVSQTQGFIPSAATLAYEGADTFVTVSADADGNPLESGVVYYVLAAGYDTFGDDNLTLTAELSATILSPAWGLLQDDIETSMLESGLQDRIDKIDTAGDSDFPTGLVDGFRQTNTEVEILDTSVNDVGQKLLESALKVQENTDLLYDAGVTVDSTTGEVYIFAVRESENRLDSAEIRLDAAESNINLRATTTYVDEQIAEAVIDPSQIAELESLFTRVGEAEVDIDGLEASVTLKASQLEVDNQGARLTTAEGDINALEGQITLKADNIELQNTTARVTTVEQEINALDVPSITQSVQDIKFVERQQDQIAETQLKDILTGEANYDNLDVGIAKASNDLRAYTDGQLIAEATARLKLEADLGDTSAALEQESIARATADNALSSQVTTLQSTVGDNSTSVQVLSQSVDGIEGKYSVKIDANGYVSGYGLISTANDAVPFADFQVIADRFSIAPVATNPTAVDGSPFFVLTSATNIDGVTVQPGTYMKKAFIYDAVITTAKIEDAAITNAKVANASIDSAKITSAAITNAKIANAAITTAKIADAQITNAKIVDLDATKITTGLLNADRIGVGSIDAKIASINNAQIANLDAGKITTGTIDAARINADEVAANIANIDAAIITTGTLDTARIANGSITSAKIGDAQITTAKIGTAQVDTLTVAGNAITVQGSVSRSTEGSASFTINAPFGGQLLIIAFTTASNTGSQGTTGVRNELDISVNGSAIFSVEGQEVFYGFEGDPEQGVEELYIKVAQTAMNVISVGSGNYTISGSGGGLEGFVLTALLTQR